VRTALQLGTWWMASIGLAGGGIARADSETRAAPGVEAVDFAGATQFEPDHLLRFLATRPTTFWYRRRFEPAVFERDLGNLQSFYRDEGFLSACVWSGALQWNSDSTQVRPTVLVHEGPRWQVASLDISGELPISNSAAAALLSLRPGTPYRPVALDRDQRTLQELCTRAAYLDARIEPRLSHADRRVAIAYDVQLGELSRFGAVSLQGNQKTRPHVVQRELGFIADMPLTSATVADAQARLIATGLFESATIAVRPGQEGRVRKSLDVIVVERTSRDATIGAGFATTEGLRLRLQLRERNWGGTGQRIGLDGRLSERRRILEASFTDPWLAGIPLALDVVAAYDWQNEPSFKVESLRGSAGVRRHLGRRWSGDAGIRLKRTHLLESRTAGSNVPRNRVGRFVVGVERDSRDDLFDTNRGGFLRLETGIAGSALGSGQEVLSAGVLTRRVLPLTRRLRTAFAYRHDAAWLQNAGEELPIEDRFFSGGDGSVRGFPHHGVGPQDAAGTPLGGNHRSEASFEVRLGLHRRLDVVGYCDAGQVTRFGSELRLDGYSIGAGGGLRVRTPWGLLRGEFGVPISEAGPTLAHFAVGQPF